MPSLERFFDPQMRKFDANVRPLPGARLYFFENGTTTPKPTYKDKQGSLAHDNPVIADSTGVFPQIFLDGLYRVELRSSSNIPQPGWPIDNIGQDTPVVPFGPWVEVNTYNEGEVVTGSNGNWYRSLIDENLGNDPISSPTEWEVIPIPVASSFTSNKAYLTWADDGDQVSLNVDTAGLVDEIEANIDEIDGNLAVAGGLSSGGQLSIAGDSELSGSLSVGTTLSVDGTATFSDQIDLTSPEAATEINLTGSGDFTSGRIKLRRIDDTVVINSNSVVGHASGSSASSAIGLIPSTFRPTSEVSNVYYFNDSTGLIARCTVNPAGTLQIIYGNYSGGSSTTTSSQSPFSLTFNA